MADPYRLNAAPPGALENFPGHLQGNASGMANHQSWNAINSGRASAEFLPNDVLLRRPSGYNVDDHVRMSNHVAPGVGSIPSGVSMRMTPEDPIFARRDAELSRYNIANIEQSEPVCKVDELSANASGLLYVDGLPTNCTRREVSHLFRPFIGYKDIRVIHKEPRRKGEKAYVLCFVEFTDAKCASTALEALQGYKFDEMKPNAPALKIQFAKFPFQPPGRE